MTTTTRYSLGRPHPGHIPTIGREYLGRTWGGGRTYGTTLRCSCGWKPGVYRWVRNSEQMERPDDKVSNEAPSRGGRVTANARYREHLEKELA